MSRTLYVFDWNYSSWSMRAGLAMRLSGKDYEEVGVMTTPAAEQAKLRAISPSGKFPMLVHGDRRIWDSMAIAEYLAERKPSLWPTHRGARAHARSISAEMHSSFLELRTAMPMNIRRTVGPVTAPDIVEQQIARIQTIWTDCRKEYGKKGSFLFGRFTLADAFYAPVVMRFRTYGVELRGAAKDYATAVEEHPHVQDWIKRAVAQEYAETKYEVERR